MIYFQQENCLRVVLMASWNLSCWNSLWNSLEKINSQVFIKENVLISFNWECLKFLFEFSLLNFSYFRECTSDCLLLCVWQQSIILFVVYSSSAQVWLCSCLMSCYRRDMVLDLGKDGQFDLQNCIVESLYHFLKEVMCHKFIIHIVFISFCQYFPLYCHQHLWDDRLEGFQSSNNKYWSR